MRHTRTPGLLFAALVWTTAAHAADPRLPFFEIAPFVGQRLGGDFEVDEGGTEADLDDAHSLSLALDLRRDPLSQYELFYGRQETELEAGSPLGSVGIDVEYLHVGGTLIVTDEYRFAPYIVGTLGATRMRPEGPGVRDETRFSLSLGAGVRIPVSARFALRLEARGFLTFLDTDSTVFCASGDFGGLCRIRSSGSTFIQYDLLAGAVVSF